MSKRLPHRCPRTPLLASSVRLPVSRELIRSHAELLFMLGRVLGRMPAGGDTDPGPFIPTRPMHAPSMLGVLLDREAKAGGGDSVLDCLADLREQMSDVRAFLRAFGSRMNVPRSCSARYRARWTRT